MTYIDYGTFYPNPDQAKTQTLALPDYSVRAPTIFFPGWGCGKYQEYADFAQSLADRRQSVVHVLQYNRPPPEGWEDLSILLLHRQQRWKQEIGQKALACLAAASSVGVDVVGFSEGALHATLAIQKLPTWSKVNSLVLINPAGITGVISNPSILVRVVINEWHKYLVMKQGPEEVRARMRVHADSIKFYLEAANGWVLSLLSAGLYEAMKSGRVDFMKELRRLARAMSVKIIAAKDDVMIPVQVLKQRYGGNIAMEVIPGSHFNFFQKPEEMAERAA